MVKEFWKWTLRTIGAISFATLVYLLAGEYLGRVTVNRGFEPDPSGIKIFVISNNIHTDIVLPARSEHINWLDRFPTEEFTPVPELDPVYIAFGWGERNLYENVPTWDDLTVPIFAHSMFIPTESTMHVTYYLAEPKTSEFVKAVNISPQQYEILIAEIQEEFLLDERGNPQPLNCCWYPRVSDNFYASPKSYHVLRTCNNWTNRTLRRTGIPTALWTPFPDKILIHLPD